MIEERHIGWLGHIYRMEDSRMTKKKFVVKIQGKNKVGPPWKRWEDQACRAVERKGVNDMKQRRTGQEIIEVENKSETLSGK